MKLLSRILTICLCSAPVLDFAAHAVVATNAGHNLTAFNPSNSNNNQWATLTNIRDNSGQPAARADFGNCNAVIMRCATPKCANGGCVDSNVAAAIVAGCVQSNDSCSQYGNELVSYMTAQLVANSTAKVNAQRAAADAAAAAQSANAEQTAAQIAQMQASMQQQMAQMQQQMAQQNAQTQQQLQSALAAQAEQNAAALQSMSAATSTTPAAIATVASAQESAIERGISSDILVRQQITGQIMTEIENAETSLKEARTAMQNSFEYAGCDSRGNNCSGPKRVKKWRELATEFLDPYDNTIDKIYDALITAQTVGVNLDDIYMMLNNSCNAWAQYMCPPGAVSYPSGNSGQKGAPFVCDKTADAEAVYNATVKCKQDYDAAVIAGRKNNVDEITLLADAGLDYDNCITLAKNTMSSRCQQCTILKVLNDKAEVYEGWVYSDKNSETNQTVVACASDVLDSSKLFTRRTRSKNGAGLVDIDQLDIWLHQVEPNIKDEDWHKYCYTSDQKEILQSSRSSRVVPARNKNFCVEEIVKGKDNKSLTPNTKDCPFIAGTYAICDTHPYNAGQPGSTKLNATEIEEMREIVALKVTVISQQIYKQYEYLNATLRRLKTQLEKSVLTTTLEAAGAKSEDGSTSSSSGGLLGGGKNSQYANCSGKDIQEAIYCLRQNYSVFATQINNKKCSGDTKKRLADDLRILNGKIPNKADYNRISADCMDSGKIKDTKKCSECLEEYSNGLNTLEDVQLDKEARRAGRYRD